MRRQRAAFLGPSPENAGPNTWTPLGPAPIVSAAFPGSPQDYGFVSGRATAVAIDPADATGNTVYIGGAHGGVWKSVNAASPTASQVVWTPVADFAPTLAVGSIAIQPGNSNPNTSVILVGTGEPNNSADSYYGLGILRSANGGATWSLIQSDITGQYSFAGLGFSKIAFSTTNPQIVVAAAATAYTGELEGLANQNNRGIYVSTDGGQTWNYASIQDAGTTIAAASVTSVIYHPAAGRFFAAIRFHGIYSSSDGAHWTRLADANQPGSNLTSNLCPPSGAASCLFYRAELSVPVVPLGTQPRNELYTWVVDVDTTVNPAALYDGGIWVNSSGGASPWEPIADGGITACGDQDGCGVEQGTYNLEILAVADGSETDVYAGAINLYKCTIASPASNSPSCSSPFMNLTHVYGCSSIAKVHPDQHHLAAVITNSTALMYFANDGGIYRALDGYMGLTTGTCGASNQVDNLNGTLGSMTQFVSISTHPTDETVIFGGTQDNGSPMTHSGLPSLEWQSIHAGDGGYNAINPVTLTDWFASYPDTGEQTLEIDHCSSGTTCDATQFSEVISSADLAGDDGAFYFPYLLDPQASQELLLGTCRVWRVDNASSPTRFTALSPDFEPGAVTPCSGAEVNTVRALAAGGPTDSNGFSKVIYAGTDGYGPVLGSNPLGGRVFVTTDASVPNPAFTEVTGSINPSAYPVSDIAIDFADPTGQTAYAAIMGFHVGHVFKTTNAGTTWTDFTGSLPDAPVNSIVVDPQAGVIYAGTDGGVFATPTAAANWTEIGPAAAADNSGFLPNIPVTSLRLFNANGEKLLRASTYGRGVWQYAVTTAPDYSIAVTNSPLTVFGSQTSNLTGYLTSFNGYSNGVDVSCTAGSTAPPSTCTVAGSPIMPTTGGAPLNVTVGGSIGDYSFNLHGTGTDSSEIAHDTPAILHVVDFAISAPTPANPFVSQGNSVSVTFSVSALGSFQGTVNLTCSELPTDASCAFSPASAQPTANSPVNVTLTLSAAASTPTGTNQVVISATTPGAPAPKTQPLNVTFAPLSFTFANAGNPQTVHAGQPASYSLTLTPGQNSPLPASIQFSCSQADLAAAIAQCSFSPPQISAGASGTQNIALTITTAGPASQTQSRPPSNGLPKTGQPPWTRLVWLIPVGGLFAAGFSKRAGKRSAWSPAILTLFVVAVELILISCGSGSNSNGTSSLVTVTVSPATASVYPTQTQQFIAAVTGSTNTAVNWTASQGSIDVNGLYTPPATIANNTSATVTATSEANSSATGVAAVTILAIAVQVTPASTTLYPSQMQQFNATVSGSTDTGVTWTLPSGPGTINASGLYTAPSSLTSNQHATVKATSDADQTKSQTAQIALAAQTPSGTYTIHVNATSGTLVETTTASLTVQ